MARRIHSQSGFTLLETLVAAVLVVIVLGSITLTNRTLSQGAQTAQANLQLNALADEAIDQVTLFHDTLPAGTKLSTAFGLSVSTTSVGLFAVNQTPLISGCSGTGCIQPGLGGPEMIQWCNPTASDATGFCAATVAGTSRTGSGTTYAAMAADSALKLDGQSAELVAVRRTAYTKGYADWRQIVDASNPSKVGESFTVLSPATSSQATDWGFYLRTIQVKRLALPDTLPPLYSNAGLNAAALRQATYVVTVSVKNYSSNQNIVRKTVTLTDWR